jgi:hypothetical protein
MVALICCLVLSCASALRMGGGISHAQYSRRSFMHYSALLLGPAAITPGPQALALAAGQQKEPRVTQKAFLDIAQVNNSDGSRRELGRITIGLYGEVFLKI